MMGLWPMYAYVTCGDMCVVVVVKGFSQKSICTNPACYCHECRK